MFKIHMQVSIKQRTSFKNVKVSQSPVAPLLSSVRQTEELQL